MCDVDVQPDGISTADGAPPAGPHATDADAQPRRRRRRAGPSAATGLSQGDSGPTCSQVSLTPRELSQVAVIMRQRQEGGMAMGGAASSAGPKPQASQASGILGTSLGAALPQSMVPPAATVPPAAAAGPAARRPLSCSQGPSSNRLTSAKLGSQACGAAGAAPPGPAVFAVPQARLATATASASVLGITASTSHAAGSISGRADGAGHAVSTTTQPHRPEANKPSAAGDALAGSAASATASQAVHSAACSGHAAQDTTSSGVLSPSAAPAAASGASKPPQPVMMMAPPPSSSAPAAESDEDVVVMGGDVGIMER